MGGKSSPPTPNYAQAATAQGQANTATGIAQSYLNNPNMITPYGSSSYTDTPVTYDANGNPILSRGTETQTLSPAEQALLTSGQQAQQTSLNILNQDAPNIQNALLQPFGYSGAAVPQGGFLPGTGPTQGMQYGIGPTGPIQGQINTSGVQPVPQAGPGFMNNVEESQYAQGAQFLNPQFQQAQQALTAQLANQGIAPGSAAYNQASNNLALQQQGAYQNLINSSITGGQQAAQGLYGMQLAGNQAGFGEAQSAGTFANSAQQQQEQELLSQAGLTNQAVSGQASIASNMAQLAAQEQAQGYSQYAENRTMPINMISALLSQGQVQNPTFNSYQPTAINAAPIMQGAQLQGQANAAQASANAGKLGSGLGALGNIGSGYMAALPFL